MLRYINCNLDELTDLFKINAEFLSNFIFRGQSNSKWPLQTSLERSINSSSNTHPTFRYNSDSIERAMLHEFKRKYPLYSSVLPEYNDHLEWLAIMQHHGAPTRLLDFTYSLWVACYFALIDSKTEASIWFVNERILRDNLRYSSNVYYTPEDALVTKINAIHIEFANTFLYKELDGELPNTVINLIPKISTERLSRQQGLFLMPTNLEIPFIKNLSSAFQFNIKFNKKKFSYLLDYAHKYEYFSKVCVIKIDISLTHHKKILTALKQMNITAETLFPGVDGLAKSLQHSHIQI